ncbi:MAG TPA: methylated-DNA--[protein]-cysteine S-methyltransferase [Ktedonobacteraceae bacterium]|jgi:O-6-methylguanine DNA methyltransferase
MITLAKTRVAAEVLYQGSVVSDQGTCEVIATEKGVCWSGTPGTERDYGLNWLARRLRVARVVEGESIEPLRQALDQLRRYFAGEPVQFSCPLDLRGTPFQLSVWEELYCIPYGQTRTYAQIASAIGCPKAARAVGAANGANPVAVIVPCHRVIGSDGALTGYGGGLYVKAWLLALEGVVLSA